MYANDSSDIMLPNAPDGQAVTTSWCSGQQECLNGSDPTYDNTNPIPYQTSLLAPYMGEQIAFYRCPGDTVLSPDGQRLRSYSMNGAMGQYYLTDQGAVPGLTYGNGMRWYSRVSDLDCPVPSMALIFVDENAASIDDGWLQIGGTAIPQWPNAPAWYHCGSCGMGFADGHAEIHKWQTSVLDLPVNHYIGKGCPALAPVSGSVFNQDWQWWLQRIACGENVP
jgi:hypothetical protein